MNEYDEPPIHVPSTPSRYEYVSRSPRDPYDYESADESLRYWLERFGLEHGPHGGFTRKYGSVPLTNHDD